MDLPALQVKAQKIITKHGGVVTLVVPSPAVSPDPVTDLPTAGTTSNTEYTVHGVFPPPGRTRLRDGAFIQIGDTVKVPANELPVGVRPQAGWLVRTLTRTYRVVSPVRDVTVDGVTTVIYELDLEGV